MTGTQVEIRLNRWLCQALVFILSFAWTSEAGEQERSASARSTDARPPIVVFMTDYGYGAAVAVCKGVMLSIEPNLRIIDLSHTVRPFDIAGGARLLEGAVKYYPAGTVFVGVVDPGVGTERRALAARTKSGHYLVGPDNGLLSYAIERFGAEEVRVIDNADLYNKLDPLSNTFHGRDIYSPVGARLAIGMPLEGVGPLTTAWVKLERPKPTRADGVLRGVVMSAGGAFGNARTNIPSAWAESIGLKLGDFVQVRIGGRQLVMRFVRTFGEVALGELLIYSGSGGVLDIAIREGNLAATHGVQEHDELEVRKSQPR